MSGLSKRVLNEVCSVDKGRLDGFDRSRVGQHGWKEGAGYINLLLLQAVIQSLSGHCRSLASLPDFAAPRMPS